MSTVPAHPRRTLLVGIGVLLAAAPLTAELPAANATPAPAAATASVRTCPTRDLGFFLGGRNGTAGASYYHLRFENYGSRTCKLRGFPGVSAITKNGHQLGRAAARDHTYSARTVKLRPHQSAVTVLRVTDVANYSRSSCRPTHAWGVRVYPPNDHKSQVLHFGLRVCKKRGPRYLSVQVVRRHT
jgi:hypothetical protein